MLIVFLFRKIERIPQQEMVVQEAVASQFNGTRMHAFRMALSQFFLKFLERLMHRSKLLSLKFHNMSNEWFHSIRQSRQKKLKQLQQRQEAMEQAAQDAEKEHAHANEKVQFIDTVAAAKPVSVSRPMISRTIVRSKANVKPLSKGRLEDALIKRIAVNPRDIEAYERLGDYYMEGENYRDALECFKQVLKLSPAHHKARLRIRKLESIVK